MSLVRFRRNRTGLRGYVYIRRRKRKKMLLLHKITFSFLERQFIGCSSQSFYFTENSKSLTSSSKCFKKCTWPSLFSFQTQQKRYMYSLHFKYI